MDITVAELAIAVGKQESYVRQHIQRGHLDHVKDGRNVFVTTESATLWAKDWGLTLNLPVLTFDSADPVSKRTARMAVLAWHPENGDAINLFTHVRHRREDALGPWAGTADDAWITESLPFAGDGNAGEVRLHLVDKAFDKCESHIGTIISEGVLKVNGDDILYALEDKPRRHWAYRDERGEYEPAISSPFSRHSAEVIEYWSFNEEGREIWLSAYANKEHELHPIMSKLRFELGRLSDRVGNLMISGAFDSVECHLSRSNQAIVLTVEDDNFAPSKYWADIWALHSGDTVLRRSIVVNQSETAIDLKSDEDRFGFALFRTCDGQCIDLMDSNRIMEINIANNFQIGPTIQINGRGKSPITTISPFNHQSMLTIKADKDSAELDRSIRREFLDRRVREDQTKTSREGNFARFEPDHFSEAVEYFLQMLHRHTYSSEPIYIADPYFMNRETETSEHELYWGIFDATVGRPLRILCGQDHNQVWWSNFPSVVTNHVAVRAYVKHNPAKGKDEPGFHDRYLITREGEFVITNSFNGWSKHGVTFVKLPYGVYAAQTDQLWAMHPGFSSSSIRVSEVK